MFPFSMFSRLLGNRLSAMPRLDSRALSQHLLNDIGLSHDDFDEGRNRRVRRIATRHSS